MSLRDIVIEKARKAGVDELGIDWMTVAWEISKESERESCAMLIEQYDQECNTISYIGEFLADRIRAREAS